MGKERSIIIEIEESVYGELEAVAEKQGSKLEDEVFVVMREQGIKEAFAFDQHFDQMEFIRKP